MRSSASTFIDAIVLEPLRVVCGGERGEREREEVSGPILTGPLCLCCNLQPRAGHLRGHYWHRIRVTVHNAFYYLLELSH